MLKQRLVGAAVIIALAVVLIPMILDGAGKHLVPNIPHEPNYLKTHDRQNLSTRSQKLPASGKIDVRIAAVISAPANTAKSVKVARSGKIQIKKNSTKNSTKNSRQDKIRDPKTINSNPGRRKSVYSAIKVWSVQIASFSSRDNARVLKRKLSRAGFKAYILQTRSRAKRRIYRVRIGPETSHKVAKATLARLRQEVRLNGFITSHK